MILNYVLPALVVILNAVGVGLLVAGFAWAVVLVLPAAFFAGYGVQGFMREVWPR